MKLFLLLLFVGSAHADLHSYIITFTGVRGIPALPDFTSLTTVDGIEVDYYDSNINKLIPKQEWMKKPNFTDFWKEVIENHAEMYKTFLEFVNDAKNVSHEKGDRTGTHTFQRMSGCVWNDETNWFDRYAYDGNDFSSVNLITKSYIPHVHEAVNITQRWNREHHTFIHYNKHQCLYLLKGFFTFARATFKKTVPLEVSLLQKFSSSAVVCLATGFYPASMNLTWTKNGQDHHEDVEIKETLPNGDGTFQKRIILRVKTEEWQKNQYSCVVQHKSLTKDIRKILTKDEIKSNSKLSKNLPYFWILPGLVVFVEVGIIILTCRCKTDNNRPDRSRDGSNNTLLRLTTKQL